MAIGGVLLCASAGGWNASAQEKADSRPSSESLLVRERIPATPAERGVDSIKRLALPGADDWKTEIEADEAKHVLDAIGAVIKARRRPNAGDLAPHFVEGCRVPALRPDRFDDTIIAGTRVRRFQWGDVKQKFNPADALTALVEPHGDAADLRIFFKVVTVNPAQEGQFTTGVYVELNSADGPSGRVQQNAEWTVAWRSGEQGDPQCQGITPIRMSEVHSSRPQFVDQIHRVIRDAEVWTPQLERGNDWWVGRVDALCGASLIGSEGIAVGDVNGDGLDDLYVCMIGGLPNKLLVQQPDGTVRDTAAEAHVDWLDESRGALLVDMDNDGDQDLVVALESTIGFLENDGRGVFTPRRRYIMPPTNLGPFYSLAAADFDQDGDLDIYCSRYQKAGYFSYPPEPYYDANNGPSNHLLRNDGKGGIKDVTNEVGLDVNNRRFSVVATWFDYDEDGDQDLYVANDFGRNNLYRNDGGRFTDVAVQAGAEDQASGMGISWSDYDLDGDFDLLVSNMFSSAGRRITYQPRSMAGDPEADREALQRLALGNTLLASDGKGRFTDRSEAAGIVLGRWAWGAMFVDINNDGYDDMVVPNGFITGPSKDDL
ncbi:MAG TPA: VCBS repeat-containing protein [Phycisphaerae bacterium]|nr:VCBS repeat-containing protein [Phycisphaerae bacterium]